MASTPISRLEEGSLRRNSLPPLEAPGNRPFLAVDETEGNCSKGRRGSKRVSGGSGGGDGCGKDPRHRNSGDNISPLNNDSSDSNSVGGGRYAGEDRFQDEEPLPSLPLRSNVETSPRMSAVDSDGGDRDKGKGGGGAVGGENEEAACVGCVDSAAGGQEQDGCQAPDEEWINHAIREMDIMRKGIERRNSANETNGFNAIGGGGGEQQRQNPQRDESQAGAAGKGPGYGTASTEAMEAIGEDGGVEEGDEDSAQRLFIGWIQARQWECVTLVSLGCVTSLFVKHVSTSYSGTIPMMVTFIPLVVHILLVRDIYVKWEDRQRRKARRRSGLLGGRSSRADQPYRYAPPGWHAASTATSSGGAGDGVDGLDGVGRPGGAAGGLCPGGESVFDIGSGGGAGLSPMSTRLFAGMDFRQDDGDGGGVDGDTGGGGGGVGAYEAAVSSSSNDSNTSSLRSGVGGPLEASAAPDGEDYWSDVGGKSGLEGMNVMHYLETPFQKSVRLLNTACENVNDPIVRKVLKTIAKLLSDPASLHQVKEGSIRRMTMDLGTRNYIENVLQTPVKSTSAEDNWKKLRTGMFVVRAMAREAAAAEDFLSAYKTRHTTKEERSSDDDAVSADGIDPKSNELDDLLEDIESGLDTTSQDVATLNTDKSARTTSRSEPYAEDADTGRFCRLNRSLILGQQLVAKTLSRGDLRKDPDRLSVKELRDLVSEHKTPEKIDEDPMQAESLATNEEMGSRWSDSGHSKATSSDYLYERRNIPRLPVLPEEASGGVASLLADGGFLKWDFNVFTLEERSQGHSLWFAAMSAFSHYNIIGAFGLSVDRLSQMLLCVEASYCYNPKAPNTYHTHVHAADVILTVSHFLSVEAIANTVRSTHGLALLMAAIMHDYRHPGVNNGYLVRDLDPLAVVYNDVSVLENFHAAEGFKMMLDPAFDILRGWKAEDVKFFRHAFVKCILATDLALSLEYVSKFQSLTTNMASAELSRSSDKGGSKLGGNEISNNNSIQVQILVLQMVLKVADVAHPCKPWEVHHKWSELVTEEFFKQGDREAARGLAMSPLCDRSDQNLPKSQCDFIDFIVRPCVSIFSMYCKVTTWNDQLDNNFRTWKALYEEQGGAARRPTSPGSPVSRRRSLR